jgi:Zn-dependent protease with chaperone function
LVLQEPGHALHPLVRCPNGRPQGRGLLPSAQVLPAEVVKRIEEQGAAGRLEQFAWIMLIFVGCYAVIMLGMAGVGVLLAKRTHGSRTLQLLGAQPDELVSGGQVARSHHETSLARLYGYALVVGLVLFYAAIPFILAGLLVGTGLLLYAVFLLPRIPIKLILIIVVVGGGGAWAVVKSLFARSGSGSFGLPKTPADCPRLHELLADVPHRVDTEPVSEVYLAPGSSIGVHQEGRGPFGIFGVKSRVLTLGLSTMRFLTISELRAILAHEYAHFSHSDTFYSRFTYQVHLSIEHSLQGTGQSGGKLNYVNPFYWFLYLYYKAYSLLSAGFSRSREFLADRMAATLYGSDVFATALTKVCTDGTLFEMTMYDNISELLEKDQAFVNMYATFRSYRDEQLTGQAREELYQKLLDEKESLFASHPIFGERIQAIAPLPRAEKTDDTLALELFDNAEELEKELTDFLTGFMHHVRQLQAAAQQ